MTHALVGHTGFVGGNLLRQHSFGALYNSRNIEEISGRQFETLVFSGAQAVKWWANQNPDEDWAGIRRALDALQDVRARRAILMSTIDVLPNVRGADESTDCHAFENHAYGRHRLELEETFRTIFPGALVVRLPALFGPGLKKNVIYDLLHANMLEKIEPRSRFQYYDLEGLWADIERVLDAGLELIHLFPEPVATAEILERFFPDAVVGGDPMPAASYDLRTRHAGVFGRDDGYIAGKDTILDQLGRFIEAERSRMREEARAERTEER